MYFIHILIVLLVIPKDNQIISSKDFFFRFVFLRFVVSFLSFHTSLTQSIIMATAPTEEQVTLDSAQPVITAQESNQLATVIQGITKVGAQIGEVITNTLVVVTDTVTTVASRAAAVTTTLPLFNNGSTIPHTTPTTNSTSSTDGSSTVSSSTTETTTSNTEEPYYWEQQSTVTSSPPPVTKVITHNIHWMAMRTWGTMETVGEFFAEVLGLYNGRYEWAMELQRREEEEAEAREMNDERRRRYAEIQRLGGNAVVQQQSSSTTTVSSTEVANEVLSTTGANAPVVDSTETSISSPGTNASSHSSTTEATNEKPAETVSGAV